MKNYLLLTGLVVALFAVSCTPDPVPCFNYEVIDEYSYKVEFKNCTEEGVSYDWDFGDGNVSTEENPFHTYAEPGSYVVKLLAQGEKEAVQTTKTVEVALPIDLMVSDPEGGSVYSKNYVLPVELYAVNGIKSLLWEHFFDGKKETLRDTTYDGTATDLALDLERNMPFVYRPESEYEITMTDMNDEVIKRSVKIPSQDAADTTGATVSLSIRDGDVEYEFDYSYGKATYYEKEKDLDIWLYDADGDYIEFKFVQVVAEEVSRYEVNVYRASDDKTWEKKQSRKGAQDKLTMSKADLASRSYSGKLLLDVDLDMPTYDVMTINFDDVSLTSIKPNR